MYRRVRCAVVAAGIVSPLLGLLGQPGHGAERSTAQLVARSLELDDVSSPRPEPLRLPDLALEPIDWNALEGWAADDHAAAFATFLVSCRPMLRSVLPQGETRPMYFALTHVCQRALVAGRLTDAQARMFFEHNFRPLRITKLGDSAGFLTGYYEPIVDGSRFPTGIFKVPIYRRPPDLVPPRNASGSSFPNKGQSLRRTAGGELVPYYDRGEILDGALDGQHLEICWIRDQTDALLIQIQGSARVRLEDGTILRINYDAHNGFPSCRSAAFSSSATSLRARRYRWSASVNGCTPIRRAPRRCDAKTGPSCFSGSPGCPMIGRQSAHRVCSLTPERSIAVDNSMHVYGTPFFIQAQLPLTGEKRTDNFDRLMIAQDTGSAIVGPAPRPRISIGERAIGRPVQGRLHQPGNFAMWWCPENSILS